MKNRFTEDVEKLLTDGGWSPSKKNVLSVTLPSDYYLFLKAESILKEFGGLKIGVCGKGVECATSNFVCDPHLAEGLSIHTGLFTKDGMKLFPLGEIHNGHATLLIDESGAIYIFFDKLEYYASSFDQAIIKMLVGLK